MAAKYRRSQKVGPRRLTSASLRRRLAVAEGFEPYSATWSEHRNTGDLQKTMTAVHGSYPLVIRICVQSAAKEGFGWLSDADGSIQP
jgi:hypothetical protein